MKYMTYFILILLFFSSFNRKYLKFIKMDISVFEFKLFIYGLLNRGYLIIYILSETAQLSKTVLS